MDNRREKIQLLTRTNRGRVAAPSFLATLSEALGEPIGQNALTTLPQSDALMELFRNGYQAVVKEGGLSYRRFFLRGEQALVLRLANCLADRLPTERVFFLTKQSKTCGAVSISASSLLRNVESIIRFDGDSLSAVSMDGTQGLLIDHNADDDEQSYEVAVWGDRWPLLALSCEPR
jgi:hypothetical protein